LVEEEEGKWWNIRLKKNFNEKVGVRRNGNNNATTNNHKCDDNIGD